MDYKQKITSVSYFDNVVKISLAYCEWNSCNTWVQSIGNVCSEQLKLNNEWFTDLYWLVMFPISKDINFSNKNYHPDEDITFDMPRDLLRMFVCSIGQIAYSLEVKSLTSLSARNILDKVNAQLKEQIPNDDNWVKYGF